MKIDRTFFCSPLQWIHVWFEEEPIMHTDIFHQWSMLRPLFFGDSGGLLAGRRVARPPVQRMARHPLGKAWALPQLGDSESR